MVEFIPTVADIAAQIEAVLAAHISASAAADSAAVLPLCVLIDGPSGAGKTTLAALLGELLAPQHPQICHMDDFYLGWNGLDAGVSRAHHELLTPFAAGENARFQVYDWGSGQLGAGVHVSAAQMLILEGCGSFGAAVPGATYLRLWVSADDDLRQHRALSRGGEGFDAQWANWDAQFTTYVSEFQPEVQALLVIRAAE